MTTTTIDQVPAAKPARPSLRRAAAHALIITKRNLLLLPRSPEIIVFVAIQPIMFTLLFRYVFGGAIATPGTNYVNFLIPGIVVQMVAFTAFGTGIGINEDVNKGILDRFRSLPMARSAFLTGRILSDSVRIVFSIALLAVVGFLVGFRITEGIGDALLAFLIAAGFGVSICWVGAWIGLTIHSPEAVQSGGFIWIFPLTFISSAFAPPESMPGWLQGFVKVNPVTIVVDTLRGLLNGGPYRLDLDANLVKSVAWIAAISLVFFLLAIRQYRRIS
jgi:ABC-2 type transport system permease protein/oleandomycin transport system permease protein